jgi:branched-chain amino acid transport system ATP-binding protein
MLVNNLHAFYGKSHVLHGVHFEVGAGEIVACSGATARPLDHGQGHHGPGRGTARCWKGTPILGRKPFEIAHLGIGYVPENRDIFPELTVHQNLMLGEKGRRQGHSRWGFDDMYRMFPRLKERQHTEAGVLSGGEQQMLTLCRTLMGDPDLIMIDEPTEGLAPKIVELVAEYLQRAQAARHLGAAGRAEADHRARGGRPLPGDGPRQIVFEGTPEALRANAAAQGVARGLGSQRSRRRRPAMSRQRHRPPSMPRIERSFFFSPIRGDA